MGPEGRPLARTRHVHITRIYKHTQKTVGRGELGERRRKEGAANCHGVRDTFPRAIQKRFPPASRRHDFKRLHIGQLLLIVPADPHAGVLPMYEKRIKRFVRASVLLVGPLGAVPVPVPAAAPPRRGVVPAQFVADKVHAFLGNLQKRRRVRPELGRERDAVVLGANGDFPAEAAGKPNGDVPEIGDYFNVEVGTGGATFHGGVMLFCVIRFQFFYSTQPRPLY
jgi:hypothetical protein